LEQRRGNLEAAFETGRTTWPNVPLSFQRFSSRIVELAVSTADLACHAGDLFLAVACTDRDEAALRSFESDYLSQIPRQIARFALGKDKVDEVLQRVRIKMLLSNPPGISRYRGEGPLSALLYVTAVRVALDTAAIKPIGDDAVLELAADDASTEVQATRHLYGEPFRQALEESFRALSPRDKAILQFNVVDGLNIDAIGAIYGVHRATVARWLVAIRARVFAHLKNTFAIAWKMSTSDLHSLTAVMRDYIHVSAARVLSGNR
jgi:RNA polymerase sigma-70 factor (ECF subfamily)